MEDSNNFPNAPEGISCIRDTRKYLRVWSHMFEAKDAFPDIRMAQLGTPEVRKLYKFYSRMVPVLLYLSLYRTLKLTYPTDIAGLSSHDDEDGDREPGSIRRGPDTSRYPAILRLRDSSSNYVNQVSQPECEGPVRSG